MGKLLRGIVRLILEIIGTAIGLTVFAIFVYGIFLFGSVHEENAAATVLDGYVRALDEGNVDKAAAFYPLDERFVFSGKKISDLKGAEKAENYKAYANIQVDRFAVSLAGDTTTSGNTGLFALTEGSLAYADKHETPYSALLEHNPTGWSIVALSIGVSANQANSNLLGLGAVCLGWSKQSGNCLSVTEAKQIISKSTHLIEGSLVFSFPRDHFTFAFKVGEVWFLASAQESRSAYHWAEGILPVITLHDLPTPAP